MNIPPPAPINAPDFQKGLTGLQSGFGGGTLDPSSAILEGLSKGNSILNFIKVAGYWLARGMILPAEMLFRFKVGERYVTPPVFAAFIGVLVILGFGETSKLTYGFLIGAAIGGWGAHAAFRKNAQRNGVHWHSYSEGESLFDHLMLQPKWDARYGPITTISVSKNFCEPIALLILALVCAPFWVWQYLGRYHITALRGAPLAVYFLLAAVTLAIYQLMCAGIRRGQLLDHIDAELMREALQESQKPGQPYAVQNYKGAAYIPTTRVQLWSTPTPVTPTAVSTAPSQSVTPPVAETLTPSAPPPPESPAQAPAEIIIAPSPVFPEPKVVATKQSKQPTAKAKRRK